MGAAAEAEGRVAAWRCRDWAAWAGLVVLTVCWVSLTRYSGPWFPQKAPGVGGPADDGVIRVILDPGHGGVDGGAVGNGLREKDLCLEVALELRNELEGRGWTVVMTRQDDRFLSLRERIATANGYWRAFFVSLHFNHGQSAAAEGIEVFYADPKSTGAEGELAARLGEGKTKGIAADSRGWSFATRVQRSLIRSTGAVDRGVKNRPDFAVVRHVVLPAVLVEGGFVSNRKEADRLGDPEYRKKLVQGMASGIEEFIVENGGDPYRGVSLLED